MSDAESKSLNLLGVDYLPVKTPDGGDLYLTPHGSPFLEQLRPENWYERDWFGEHREKLSGTSTVYRVQTRPVGGLSKDLVVKWNRVGEEVPLSTFMLNQFVEAEFNSPYEEFALVMEMRSSLEPGRIWTHKPLGIYVPAKRFKDWQIRRSISKIDQKRAKYRDVELDIYRQYILIYEWIKGVSAPEAFAALWPDVQERRRQLERLTERVVRDLAGKGYRVLDTKPEHFIVRPRPEGGLLCDRNGEIAYALVDFELLERTPEHEERVTASRRAAYLRHQKSRFEGPAGQPLPEHLRPASAFGVDYIYGHSESTQGRLWVVGRDPALFDYFLPERWRRTPREPLSSTARTYYTRTKDNIHLVWKISRVGERPDHEAPLPLAQAGYNSPFEEFAIALELGRCGVPTIYPRAIYMTGQEAVPSDYSPDDRRYQSHRDVLTPDGLPALRPDHNYITVWGFWNGLDELLASRDAEYCRGVNLLQARFEGLITDEEVVRQMGRARDLLAAAGFEDLNLKGSHVLLTVGATGGLLRDDRGELILRLCNFSFVRRLAGDSL